MMSQPKKTGSLRAATGSFVGAVLEWYDFLLYGIVAAVVFGKAFFPEADPLVGTLAAFATFGVGFVFRPLGGLFFGHFGDRLGRKRMLVWTVLVMGVATALIGVLPTYDTVGWWAPLLLVLLRAVQGFAVGGEWGGASLMAVENAPKGLKALYSSGVQMGYSVGLILATGVVAVLQGLIGSDAFREWGWRLPFLVSGLFVVLALWIRAGVPESEVFIEEVKEAHHERKVPVVAALKEHPGAFLQIIGMRMGELFTMYVVTTFALAYATDEFDFSPQFMLRIGLIVGAVGIVTIPLFAWLSDRFGRKPVFLVGAMVGVLGTLPYFWAMESGSELWLIVGSVVLVNLAHDMIVSVQQPLFTELFGAEYRYSGAGLGYQVASMVGGGFTPFIATALVAYAGGDWQWVAVYLGAGCAISALVALTLKPEKHAIGKRSEKVAPIPSPERV